MEFWPILHEWDPDEDHDYHALMRSITEEKTLNDLIQSFKNIAKSTYPYYKYNNEATYAMIKYEKKNILHIYGSANENYLNNITNIYKNKFKQLKLNILKEISNSTTYCSKMELNRNSFTYIILSYILKKKYIKKN
jgi:hypothetical protein